MQTGHGVVPYFVPENTVTWIDHVLSDPALQAKLLDEVAQVVRSDGVEEQHKTGEKLSLTFNRVQDAAAANVIWCHKITQSIKYELKTIADDAENRMIIGGNGLFNTTVLEDKYHLAVLEQQITTPGKLFSVPCASLISVQRILKHLFHESSTGGNLDQNQVSYILKEAGANGGEGLYLVSASNHVKLLEQLLNSQKRRKDSRMPRYVLQQYVSSPALWDTNFKYHVRMYLVLKGNGEAFLYHKCLAHIANKPFCKHAQPLEADVGEKKDEEEAWTADASPEYDREIHITNVAVNVLNPGLFHGCPVIDLRDQKKISATLLERLKTLLADYISAGYYFLRRQASKDHFSHIGVDIMFSRSETERASGQASEMDLVPHILEFNIPPCAGMYGKPMEPAMEALFEDMFRDIITRFYLEPLVSAPPPDLSSRHEQPWISVLGPAPTYQQSSVAAAGLNSLEWNLYCRSHARKSKSKQIN